MSPLEVYHHMHVFFPLVAPAAKLGCLEYHDAEDHRTTRTAIAQTSELAACEYDCNHPVGWHALVPGTGDEKRPVDSAADLRGHGRHCWLALANGHIVLVVFTARGTTEVEANGHRGGPRLGKLPPIERRVWHGAAARAHRRALIVRGLCST